MKHRFTVHGLRYTFTDLIRLSKADAVVRRALTGHVTQEMQQHYSNVGTEEKRAAIAGALKLLAGAAQQHPLQCERPRECELGCEPRGGVGAVSIERDTRFELATFSLGILE